MVREGADAPQPRRGVRIPAQGIALGGLEGRHNPLPWPGQPDPAKTISETGDEAAKGPFDAGRRVAYNYARRRVGEQRATTACQGPSRGGAVNLVRP